jgi:hypothetical protein
LIYCKPVHAFILHGSEIRLNFVQRPTSRILFKAVIFFFRNSPRISSVFFFFTS